MMISLDGYFEGEKHDLSWHNVDEEFVDFAVEQTGTASTLVFGRKTYELMHDFWPSENARKEDPKTAQILNFTDKIVFSKTLQSVNEEEYWKNIKLVKENVTEEISNLKKDFGDDIAILASNNLVVNLLNEGSDVIDEFRIMINPVAIGSGTQLFYRLNKKINFKLLKTREFKNGNILLTYSLKN